MATHSYTLGELAAAAGAEVTGDSNVAITGVAGIREAQSGDITFVSNEKYASFIASTQASAIILDPKTECHKPAMRLANPYLGYLKVVEVFARDILPQFEGGIHESAVIAPDATIGEGVAIGPYCQVESGARIGDNTTILHGSYVGHGATLGDGCLLHPRVTVYHGCEIGDRVILHSGSIIGADGFGFAPDGGVFHKIPQIGIVVLEDDVEIGAGTTIDRASVGETKVGQGTKIDNLCQIGHNCVIGKNTVIAAQTGFAGSTIVGDNCMFGGRSGSTGHLTVGDRVQVAGVAVVACDIPSDAKVGGFPAIDLKEWRREVVHLRRLPELKDLLKEIMSRIEELEKERD